MADDNLNDLLTVRQVAEILAVSERSVREFINTGELRASKIGQWRIPRAALRVFFDSHSNEYEREFQEEIEQFLNHKGNADEPTATLLVRDYYTSVPVALGAVEETVNKLLSERPGFTWRYSFKTEESLARHIFFGDLDQIGKVVPVLDGLYFK